MFGNDKENNILEKYTNELENEIKSDEGGEQKQSQSSIENENVYSEKYPKFTLSRFLKLFGATGDTPYVAIIKKLHSLLGQFGSRGLDESGKESIKVIINELNATAPEIGELVEEIIGSYGYDLDIDIPREFGLFAHFAISTWRINQINKAERLRMVRKEDLSPQSDWTKSEVVA